MSSFLQLAWQRCSPFYFSLTHQKISKVFRTCRDLSSLLQWTSHSMLSKMLFWSSQMSGLCSYVKSITICTIRRLISGPKLSPKCPSQSWCQPFLVASCITRLDTIQPLRTSWYLRLFWSWCTMLQVDTLWLYLLLSLTNSLRLHSLQSWSFHSCSSLVSSYPQTTSHGISKSSNTFRSSNMVTKLSWETSSTTTMLRKIAGLLMASLNLMTVPTHACAWTRDSTHVILSPRSLWSQTKPDQCGVCLVSTLSAISFPGSFFPVCPAHLSDPSI